MKLKRKYLTYLYFINKYNILFIIFIVLFVILSCKKIIIDIPKCNYKIRFIGFDTYMVNINSKRIVNEYDTIKYYQDTLSIRTQSVLEGANNYTTCYGDTIIDYIKDIQIVCLNNYLNYTQNDTINPLFIVEDNESHLKKSISEYLISKPTLERPVELKLIYAPTFINQNKFEVKITILKSDGTIKSFNYTTPLIYLTP